MGVGCYYARLRLNTGESKNGNFIEQKTTDFSWLAFGGRRGYVPLSPSNANLNMPLPAVSHLNSARWLPWVQINITSLGYADIRNKTRLSAKAVPHL